MTHMLQRARLPGTCRSTRPRFARKYAASTGRWPSTLAPASTSISAAVRLVDVGSGAGFDSFIAAGQVGRGGQVVGVDMTAEMLAKSRRTAEALGLAHVEFREGLAEALPVADGWADVVISNGVINLCADKQAVFAEIRRVLRPGGQLQFADIANGRPVPAEALRDIDLWTG